MKMGVVRSLICLHRAPLLLGFGDVVVVAHMFFHQIFGCMDTTYNNIILHNNSNINDFGSVVID